MNTREEFDSIQIGDNISILCNENTWCFLKKYCDFHDTDRYIGRVIGKGQQIFGGNVLLLAADEADANAIGCFSVAYVSNYMINGGSWSRDVNDRDFCFGVSYSQFESFVILSHDNITKDTDEERGGLAFL